MSVADVQARTHRLRRRGTIVLFLASVAAFAGWWVWKRPLDDNALQPIILLASGDTAGWIVPCGCTSNQSGGLLRRGTYVKELAQQGALIVVDVGGAPGGTSAYQRVKFEAILQGE